MEQTNAGDMRPPNGAATQDFDVSVIKADITKLNVDMIVNAANNTLLGGGGVDGAIHRAAGPKLLEECRTLHGCKTGEAKLTGAYDLPCRGVIHTVGPVWRGGGSGEAESLADCWQNALALCVANGAHSVAFPSISTGVFGFPVELAASIAMETVAAFFRRNPQCGLSVTVAAFDERTKAAYERALQQQLQPE